MLIKPVIVIGSSNIDLVAKSHKIPVVGETLTGTDFFMTPGGKGANQAVAAAKLGAEVIFVTRLGKDIFAEKLLANFKSVNIITKYITQLEDVPTGVALIAIDDNGKNIIIVVPGANGKLMPDDLDKVSGDIATAGAVVCQLEIPIETVEYAAALAIQSKVPFILDPAPARPLSDSLLKMVDVIKPNETEAQTITGIKVVDINTASKAADWLMAKGVKNVIITLGEKGALLANQNGREIIDRIKVKAVDSTAAGDAFTGAIAYGLATGKSLKEAAKYANIVAAISVTRFGAQASMPTKSEVDSFKYDL